MHSLTLGALIDALEQSGQVDCSAHSRLRFWNEQLGHLAAESITADNTDQAIEALKSRGRLTTCWLKPGVPYPWLAAEKYLLIEIRLSGKTQA